MPPTLQSRTTAGSSALRALRRLGLLGCALLLNAQAGAAPLRICTDQASWYPFTYVVDGQARGHHVELIRGAVEAAGQQVEFLPMPWVRCLLQAREGKVDGIATLVFNPQRSAFLQFPPDATELGRSRWSVDDIEDVVVTLGEHNYEFDGDIATLPAPVRVPRGWEIAAFLRGQGVNVDDGAPSDDANLIKLLRDGEGSVIAIADSVRLAMARLSGTERLHISTMPVRSKSFFLAFARSAVVDPALQSSIWQQIAERRRQRDASPAPTAD